MSSSEKSISELAEHGSQDFTDDDVEALGTIPLDFDPIDFKDVARYAITNYQSCATAYFQWKNISSKLKYRIHTLLDKILLTRLPSNSHWSDQTDKMDNYRDGVRMKILIAAFEEFAAENENWTVNSNDLQLLLPHQLMRMDLKIIIYRLTSAISQLNDWATNASSNCKEKKTNLLSSPISKRPLKKHISSITFTFQCVVNKEPIFRSLSLQILLGGSAFKPLPLVEMIPLTSELEKDLAASANDVNQNLVGKPSTELSRQDDCPSFSIFGSLDEFPTFGFDSVVEVKSESSTIQVLAFSGSQASVKTVSSDGVMNTCLAQTAKDSNPLITAMRQYQLDLKKSEGEVQESDGEEKASKDEPQNELSNPIISNDFNANEAIEMSSSNSWSEEYFQIEESQPTLNVTTDVEFEIQKNNEINEDPDLENRGHRGYEVVCFVFCGTIALTLLIVGISALITAVLEMTNRNQAPH